DGAPGLQLGDDQGHPALCHQGGNTLSRLSDAGRARGSPTPRKRKGGVVGAGGGAVGLPGGSARGSQATTRFRPARLASYSRASACSIGSAAPVSGSSPAMPMLSVTVRPDATSFHG